MGKRKYRFEQIAINCTQKKLPTEEDYAGYIGLEHLESGSLNVTRFGSQVPLKGEKLVMHKGDVLFGKRNAYLRRAAVCPHDGIFSAHGMVLQPREDVIDKSFFPLFISSDYFFDEVIRISVGSLSPTVNWKDLKDVEFDLPDLEEQKKLAEVLWSINDVIEAYRRLISTTDSLVKSQFIEMFGTIDLNEQHDEWVELEKLTKIYTGTTPSSTDDSNWNGDILWITPAEIKNDSFYIYDTERKLTEKGRKSKALEIMPVNTVLLSTRAPIGKVAIVGAPMACNQGFKNFACGERLNHVFLYTLLKANTEYLNSIGSGTTFLELPKAKISKVKVPVPNIEMQNDFDKFVQQVDKSKFEIEKALNELKNLYQMIIKQGIC